jgi:hypothetical protein
VALVLLCWKSQAAPARAAVTVNPARNARRMGTSNRLVPKPR